MGPSTEGYRLASAGLGDYGFEGGLSFVRPLFVRQGCLFGGRRCGGGVTDEVLGYQSKDGLPGRYLQWMTLRFNVAL